MRAPATIALGGYPWHKGMRLRRPEDFRHVWNHGQSWVHPLFVVWCVRNDLSSSRIGITASRKVGGAVQRNRARRLLREAARHLYPHLEPGWDLVLVARATLNAASEPQVEAALRALLQRSGLWQD